MLILCASRSGTSSCGFWCRASTLVLWSSSGYIPGCAFESHVFALTFMVMAIGELNVLSSRMNISSNWLTSYHRVTFLGFRHFWKPELYQSGFWLSDSLTLTSTSHLSTIRRFYRDPITICILDYQAKSFKCLTHPNFPSNWNFRMC